MTARVGMRVLRGPDWAGGDADGGEGHLGTVVALLDGHKARVLWDSGQEFTYRSGADGKFDLRVFDTAPVGVRHTDTTCAACEERHIYGMLWRCKVCRSCNLCSLCYVLDRHDIKHEFLRYNEPGSAGEVVKKRSTSLKVRAMGIFPGAKVQRGKHWAWADQDGGSGKVGEVTGFENVAPESSRNIVRVQWPDGKTNSYRLGFQGNVDLLCVEEEAGTYYYRDHLPVLSSTGLPVSPTTSSTASSTSSNAAFFHASSASSTSGTGGATFEQQKATTVKVGDKVAIQVDEDKLKELQLMCGGYTVTMIKCIGKKGEVVKLAPNGTVAVKFDKLTYRFNPSAITKVPDLSVGTMVRILTDVEQVKLLNKRIGWKPSMAEALGKVGQVTKIDSDGDVVVTFGPRTHMFSPACCVPVPPATSSDSLTSSASDDLNTSGSSVASSSSNASGSSDNEDYGELHQHLMRVIGQMAGLKLPTDTGAARGGRRTGGTVGGSSSMDRLFRAIVNGETNTVRALCTEDKSLVNTVHKGLTPLIVACHEGQKDMCSCLLAQGADINGRGDKGNTPLGAALEGKKEQIALYLLEKGANPNVRNCKERNPVHLAAYGNMPEAIKLLAQKGADVNAKDQYGDTPLHDAIERDNADAVDMLLRVKTVDLLAKDRKGFNMLQLACLKGNAHATERILSRDAGHVDMLHEGRFSALHIAATNDNVDCIKLLVKNGNAQMNLAGHKKLYPIHMSCMRGYVKALEALLELGADVNVTDEDGDTPLHLTVGTKVDNPGSLAGQDELKRRIRMACIMLTKGAYPDVKNRKGAEPLQCCPHPGVRESVKLFIQQNPGVIKKAGASSPRGGSPGARLTDPTGGLAALLHGMSLPCGAPGCMRMSDITLMPCGHKALCRNCCLNTSECPLCDTTIERRIHKRSDVDVDLANACKQM